ncbi:NAD(P)-dependent dehydrogenase (short-subunit alcohol dehydrogenase family) [Streptosporangium becharense]|uniref:NAD(P)-dependent dehydrogenase (Short-subunit alcohol dehydrogenase family) n=1 Tax=Streptosporangium becharense TaxID=1816182 RepID=A0A7W9MEF5_9ACTN|nr:SDR family NAD(P)-dependent oxidoreductase [Streptosporangium becharense]MBB2913654.1 NAD(P)-dependent dehydrogenase (short-subunit alcohol dehydrogenase family) [Streptosporangium becharense]MBB5817735.1 NAD(P)-dependent dehydrogenase (short-subunit alcohol dehydrogenase family) [Streptosporangium becharense]
MAVTIDLAGRTALVTGAAGGLGLACARALADAGADLVVSDLEGPRLTEAATALGARDRAADLTDPEQAVALAEEIGRIDILVNCAGVMRTTPLLEVTPQEWRRIIDVNLNGSFWITQAVGRRMVEQGGGSIVTLASVAARSGRPNAAHYSATKTALLSLTKSAAEALAPVRVNAVCPGIFLTPMWEEIIADRDARFGPDAGANYLQEVSGRSPLRRPGRAEELAAAVLFLASDLASFITGQALNVDGGLEMN